MRHRYDSHRSPALTGSSQTHTDSGERLHACKDLPDDLLRRFLLPGHVQYYGSNHAGCGGQPPSAHLPGDQLADEYCPGHRFHSSTEDGCGGRCTGYYSF